MENMLEEHKKELTPQWKKRVEIFEYFYTCLIQEFNSTEIVENSFNDYEFDANSLKIIEYFATNFEWIRNVIELFTGKDWTWDRLSFIDRAVIMEAVAEYIVSDIDLKIIIDQSVKTTKIYSIDENYRYVNAILDKVLKCPLVIEKKN